MPPDSVKLHDAKPVPQSVRIVVSSLTDIRYIEQRLADAGVAVEHDKVSMASAERREYFRGLQQQYNWHMLPMVFADGEFIGGELELLQRLEATSTGRE